MELFIHVFYLLVPMCPDFIRKKKQKPIGNEICFNLLLVGRWKWDHRKRATSKSVSFFATLVNYCTVTLKVGSEEEEH